MYNDAILTQQGFTLYGALTYVVRVIFSKVLFENPTHNWPRTINVPLCVTSRFKPYKHKTNGALKIFVQWSNPK